ncbi:hypothetical protein PR048_032375 [Dryococelus australis]|uniref:Uncharacterized protein n=1 Tax=Dryococelus australis TaxID=614101 RepID=A0ABQ9G524_9NEOP|nr:hypothetical protein PR048_032375 [Dryococelus australis]
MLWSTSEQSRLHDTRLARQELWPFVSHATLKGSGGRGTPAYHLLHLTCVDTISLPSGRNESIRAFNNSSRKLRSHRNLAVSQKRAPEIVGCTKAKQPCETDLLTNSQCDNRTEHLPRRRRRGANPRHSDYRSATLPLSYEGRAKTLFLWATRRPEVGWREVSMEQRRIAKTGDTGGPRENLPTSEIVRHDSHLQRSGSDPTGNRAGGRRVV